MSLVKTLTLPQIPVVDVNAKGQFVVRVLEGEKYWIRVIDRLSGAVVSEMTSVCNHVSYLKKHPMDDDSVLERCSECQVIRIYNTKTKNCNIVHSATEIVRLSDGPNDSIVVLDAEGLLSKLEWNAETRKSLRTHVQSLSFGRKIQKMCFVKCHDIFVAILSDNNKEISGGSRISPRRGRQLPRGAPTYDFAKFSQKLHEIERIWAPRGGRASLAPPLDPPLEIMAWKPGNYYVPSWKLTGSVNGVNIDPVSLTSDIEGNVFVEYGANDRILKINSFTGNILSIFLLKKNWETIRAIFWSKTDGTLIVQRDNRISSYSFTE